MAALSCSLLLGPTLQNPGVVDLAVVDLVVLDSLVLDLAVLDLVFLVSVLLHVTVVASEVIELMVCFYQVLDLGSAEVDITMMG